MSRIFYLKADLKPTSKARPRLGKYGVYTPSKTKNFEKELFFLSKKEKVFFEKDKNLICEIIFSFKKESLKNKTIAHSKKPDIDNLCKSTLDALNGSVFFDDSQIFLLSAKKIYSNKNFIEIKIYEGEFNE